MTAEALSSGPARSIFRREAEKGVELRSDSTAKYRPPAQAIHIDTYSADALSGRCIPLRSSSPNIALVSPVLLGIQQSINVCQRRCGDHRIA